MTFADLMNRHPDVFWGFLYIAWGAAYSSLISTAVLLSTLLKRISASWPEAITMARFAAAVWSLLHLTVVFSMPILIGSISREKLIVGEYMPLMFVGWGLGMLSAYLVARPLWRMKDLFATDSE